MCVDNESLESGYLVDFSKVGKPQIFYRSFNSAYFSSSIVDHVFSSKSSVMASLLTLIIQAIWLWHTVVLSCENREYVTYTNPASQQEMFPACIIYNNGSTCEWLLRIRNGPAFHPGTLPSFEVDISVVLFYQNSSSVSEFFYLSSHCLHLNAW